MRWFRRKQADKPLAVDTGRQDAMLADVRQRYGRHVQGRFQDQVAGLVQQLQGDDGLAVANRIVHETAEQIHTDVQARAAALGHGFDRRNYRAAYRQLGPKVQHRPVDIVHLCGALHAIEANAKRAMVLTDPNWLLIHTLELLDVTVSGAEFGRVPLSTDTAELVTRLIGAATRMRLTEDEPPALPPGIREVMRSNRSLPVYDHAGATAGTINVGEAARSSFLL